MSFDSILNIVVAVLLWLSVAGALLTILTFAVFPELRTFPVRLVMYLCASIAAGFAGFFFCSLKIVVESWVCYTSAIIVHYFFLCDFAWCFVVAFNFYQMIVRRNRDAELLEKWYHVCCWGIPAIFAVVVAALGQYGRTTDSPQEVDSTICYINNDISKFLAFFIPGLICQAATAVFFFFISREIHETFKGAPNHEKRDAKQEFRVYLSIFISIGLTWIFGYLMFLIPQRQVQRVLLVLFSISVPSQGLLIFVSYVLRTKPVARWASVFGICCPWCNRFEELSESTSYSRL